MFMSIVNYCNVCAYHVYLSDPLKSSFTYNCILTVFFNNRIQKKAACFTLKICRDILKETMLKFKKKRLPLVQSVIELFLAAESLSAKYLLDSLQEFEKCLSEVVKCFDDLKMGDKECIKVRLKPYY